MRRLLVGFFVCILIVMTVATVQASRVRPVWDNGQLLHDPWFIATLCDAYCGFLTFFVWVAIREQSWLSRAGWFVAIMLLGNFAMAAYALLQIARLDSNQPLTHLLRPAIR